MSGMNKSIIKEKGVDEFVNLLKMDCLGFTKDEINEMVL